MVQSDNPPVAIAGHHISAFSSVQGGTPPPGLADYRLSACHKTQSDTPATEVLSAHNLSKCLPNIHNGSEAQDTLITLQKLAEFLEKCASYPSHVDESEAPFLQALQALQDEMSLSQANWSRKDPDIGQLGNPLGKQAQYAQRKEKSGILILLTEAVPPEIEYRSGEDKVAQTYANEFRY